MVEEGPRLPPGDQRQQGHEGLRAQAIAAGIPTYLIASEMAEPRRLKEGDARLR